jgi:uncharacterized protein Usg
VDPDHAVKGRQHFSVLSANILKQRHFLIASQRFPLACFDRSGEITTSEAKIVLLPGKGSHHMDQAAIIKEYRLTTAEIVYHLPDHPDVLQSYIWQAMDIAPGYPELHKFLAFWRRELEGKVHSVRVAANPVARTGRVRHARFAQTIH